MKQNDSYRQIFDKYYKYVYAVVFNRLRCCAKKEDIEDCVSDVFVDLFRFLDSGKVCGNIKSLLYGIARNKSADMFSSITGKIQRTVSLDDGNAFDISDESDIESDSEKREIQKMLLQIILSLGEPDSVIIMQKFYYNKSSKEISEMLGIKADAVRKRQSRALVKIRELLTLNGISPKEYLL